MNSDLSLPAGARTGRAALHYAWVVAAVTFVVLLLTAGVRAAPGVLIVPLEERISLVAVDDLLRGRGQLLLYGLIGPFAAALIDRFGVRRTMAAALAVTAAGGRADARRCRSPGS